MEGPVVHQCRLCMSHESFQLNIFQEELHHKQILMKMRTCLPVKVEHGDGLPCSICYKCLSQLEQSFELWNKSFNSEAIFRHNLVRGKYPLEAKSALSITESAVSNADYQSFDHDTFFIENRKSFDSDPTGSEDIISPASCTVKENFTLICDQRNYSENFENPKRKCNRLVKLSKDNPRSTNNVVSVDHSVNFHDNCKKTAYSGSHQSALKDNELETVKNVPIGKREYFGGAETLWMDDEEFPNQESNVKNKYINKNLFGDDVLRVYGNLNKAQRNTKRTPDLSAKTDVKCNAVRKNNTHFPWEKTYNKSIEDQDASSETEHDVDTYTKSKRATPKAKETLNIGGLQFDPNHCPKCNMTLTPSQNLLAHFQSHIEDD